MDCLRVCVLHVLLGAGLLGCAVSDKGPQYVQPDRPIGQLALIEGEKLRIGYVDDKEVAVDHSSVSFLGATYQKSNKVYVEPGRRKLSLNTSYSGGSVWTTFTHHFEAGKHYRLSPELSDGFKVVIQEVGTTKTIIAN